MLQHYDKQPDVCICTISMITMGYMRESMIVYPLISYMPYSRISQDKQVFNLANKI